MPCYAPVKIGGQLTGIKFSSTMWLAPNDETQSGRLGSKQVYLLSHLASLCFIFEKGSDVSQGSFEITMRSRTAFNS